MASDGTAWFVDDHQRTIECKITPKNYSHGSTRRIVTPLAPCTYHGRDFEQHDRMSVEIEDLIRDTG